MIFACDGQTYDSGDLVQYETSDPALPLIYATPDHSRVFVVTLTAESGVTVHCADPDEIRDLATRYSLPQLLARP